jgi:hypothetical protein
MPLPASYLAGRQPAGTLINPPTGSGQFERDDGVPLTCQPWYILTKLWTDSPAAVTNGIVTSHAGAGAAGTTTKTPNGSLASSSIATLTPARNVVITVTHGSAVVAMSGTITGKRFGRTLTEAWSVTAGTTSKTFTGKKAFDTVTSITETVAADASANTIIMGSGVVFGLDFKCGSVDVIADEQDGATVTNGTLVKASTASTADPRGTYAPNGTPNGALDFQVWYLCSDLSDIY